MAWKDKEQPTSFDNQPINGLFFLDGDIIASIIRSSWVEGQKFPMIAFPSGLEFELWEGGASPIVHVFGEMDISLDSNRDDAFEYAFDVAEQCGYFVKKIGDNKIEVWGHDDDEHFIFEYDNDQSRLIDITQPKPETASEKPQRKLLPDDLAEQLPPLYANESKGDDALVLVKFFTPSANWTWYATEFDGKDTFYGLVVGHFPELGYFTLSELENLTDPMGLPIERDKFFEPTTIRELKEQHGI